MSIAALVAILAAQLAGETIAHYTGLPIPGPVLGFIILFAGLMIRGSVPEPLQKTAGGILALLPLMFVPAVVGVVMHIQRLTDNAMAIAVAVPASTILTLAVVALMMKTLVRNVPHEDGTVGPKEAEGQAK